ncbi:hypothetical protein SLE2022_133030 [Rubroshorea leprosula]
MGAEMDVSEENIGNRGIFKMGATGKASWESSTKYAMDKASPTVEVLLRKEGESTGPIGLAKKKEAKNGRNGLKDDGPSHEELSPISLNKPNKKVKKKTTHVRSKKDDNFCKELDNDSREMPNWTRKGEEKKKKVQKRRVKTCRSIYM